MKPISLLLIAGTTLLLIGMAFILVRSVVSRNKAPDDVLSTISDPFFLAYCKSQMAEWDTNGDGKLSSDEAACVTEINLSLIRGEEGDRDAPTGLIEHFTVTIENEEKKIESLAGIEYFTGLTTLNCSEHPISELDISGNTALTSLYCDKNRLSCLDVTNNKVLTTLSCVDNRLSELNVANNPYLTALYCSHNRLTLLDLKNNPALTELSCLNNQLTELNMTNNTNLTILHCANNRLSKLIIKDNTALTGLYCDSNQLPELHVAGNPNLLTLACSGNKLSELDISKNGGLTLFYCSDNPDLKTVYVWSGFDSADPASNFNLYDNNTTALFELAPGSE